MFKIGDKVLVRPDSQFINNPLNLTTQNWSYIVGEIYDILDKGGCNIKVKFDNFSNSYFERDLVLATKLGKLLAGVEDENRG
jgi:hypothetical protein